MSERFVTVTRTRKVDIEEKTIVTIRFQDDDAPTEYNMIEFAIAYVTAAEAIGQPPPWWTARETDVTPSYSKRMSATIEAKALKDKDDTQTEGQHLTDFEIAPAPEEIVPIGPPARPMPDNTSDDIPI